MIKMCRRINFFAAAEATVRGRFNESQVKNYSLDDVKCVGNEELLLNCPHREIGQHNCKRKERAGVHCLSKYVLICLFESHTCWYTIMYTLKMTILCAFFQISVILIFVLCRTIMLHQVSLN